MWGGQDKGSPIWCLLDKATEVDGRALGGSLLICRLAVELSNNDAFKAQWKTACSFTNTEHAMNGTAAADPTLETHNTHYRVPTKAGSTLFYSKLHAVEEIIQRRLIDTLCFTICWICSTSWYCTYSLGFTLVITTVYLCEIVAIGVIDAVDYRNCICQ